MQGSLWFHAPRRGRSAPGGGRAWIIAAGLGLALLLGGCSLALKFSYDRGATLAYWWMKGYVDFDDQQAPRVHALIDQWFRWHRREKLPQYARLLDQAAAQVRQPEIAPQVFCSMADAVQREMLAAYDQAVPALAEVAITLTAPQLQQLAARFEKNDAKFRERFLGGDRDDRLRAEARQVEERFERIYGTLSDAQVQRLRQLQAASPWDPERWLAERRSLQQQALRALQDLQSARARGASPQQLSAQAQDALYQIGQQAAHSPRAAYAAQQQRVWIYNCALATQMHATMSEAQRAHAEQSLRGWQDDVTALSRAD